MMNLAEKLTNLSIPNHNGRYNGPLDLAKFKGVIHIPYAWSNLALFEGLSLGIVYFIPDKNFLIQIKKHKNFFWSPPYREEVLELSEWYNPELSDVLVYFNSWEDLKFKIKNLNYQEQKDKLKNFIQAHQEKYFNIWKNIITG
jgi:hypothetical protein